MPKLILEKKRLDFDKQGKTVKIIGKKDRRRRRSKSNEFLKLLEKEIIDAEIIHQDIKKRVKIRENPIKEQFYYTKKF